MATGVHSWSKTAANNATADTSVSWPEGMAPSQVNDSARAEMASVAMWRDDINGSIESGGSSTAYTVTSNQGFASLTAMDNAVIAFVPHTTSGAAPTLSVDGLTAKKIRFATGADIPDGVLVQGTPYVVTYKNAVGEFLLHNLAGNPYSIPLGGMMPFTGTTAPNSSLVLPYGQAISRTTYATYFAMVGTTYGEGDGSTTFNIIDMRGRVPFGKDNMGGTSANRLTDQTGGFDGDTLGDAGGSETNTILQANLPNVTLATTIAAGQGSHQHNIATTTSSAAVPQSISSGAGGFAGFALSEFATLPAMSGTTPLGGSGTAINNLPPGIVCNYLLRII